MAKSARTKPTKAEHVERVKDPQKVAAGKARAAQAVRVDGKFTTNKFLDKVKEDAFIVGAKDPFQFYLQNQKVYEDLYKTKMLTTNKDFFQTKEAIKKYDGKVFKNDREVKPATLIKAMNQLNQYLRSEHDIVAFWQKIELSLGGKMNINLPSIKEIERRLEEGETIEDIMDEEGIVIIISADKE